MKKFKYITLLAILFFFFTAPNSLFANYKGTVKEGDNGKGKKPVLQKTMADPSQSLLNVNNATMWVTDAGYHDWVVASSWNGAYPTGYAMGAIFTQGIVWGGQVNDGGSQLIRIGGNTYGSGTAAITRLFRVRSDYQTADLTSDAATFNDIPSSSVSDADIAVIKAQYEKDWNEWPANEGAPYDDINGNGTYDPAEDIPGIPGATQTIFVKYDDSESASLFGANRIGMEVSEVYWAYAASGPLANVIFDKVTLVYKGLPTSAPNSVIDSMYIAQMSDPDVGTSTDDFAGCDTVLNLGYAYTSKTQDATFLGASLPPPAAGYDYLQGVSQYTGNPSDSAIFDLKWRKGYKYVNPVPMSSFAYFASGGTWGDPTEGSYGDGALCMYNLMRGVLPRPPYPSASQFPDNVIEKGASGGVYLLPGDPVTGTGKIDGVVDGPGDRRILPINGPFTMNLGDTAQVVVALVYGMGVNNLSSISVLKFNDASAQFAYDQLFNVPLMPTPDVTYSELDGSVTAYWNQNEAEINSTENEDHGPYKFQAYAVYQLPAGSKDVTAGIRIATFDVVDNISFMQDKVLDQSTGIVYTRPLIPLNNVNGIQRKFIFNKDYINNKALINGQSYTYAVTSIGYNDDPGLPQFILESAPYILNVTPQAPKPGETYSTSYEDTLKTVHTSGTSDGNVIPIVVDPTKITGMSYTVTFDTDTATGTLVWKLTRSDGVVLLKDQTDQTASDQSPIVDGIQWKVIGAPEDFKDFETIANASGPLDPPEGFSADYNGFPGLPAPTTSQQTNGSRWLIASTDAADPSYARFVARTTQYSGGNGEANQGLKALIPDDFEIRFTATGSKGDIGFGGAFDGTIIDLPFELWDVGDPKDPSDDFQIYCEILDNNDNGVFDLGETDHAMSGASNDPYTDGIYMIIPKDRTPGSAGYNALLTFATNNAPFSAYQAWAFNYGPPEYPSDPFSSYPGMIRTVLVNWNGGTVPGPYNADMPEEGTVFKIGTTKPNTLAEVFTINTAANTYSNELAKTDVNKINVFPNPYYGYQYRETSPTSKYVTFNHLPDNAIIRIFDLSGVLVKTINHVSTSGQFDTWDLTNDSNYPVASGIYIVYVDMPDLGTTKILKLAIIQEQQMLKVY
jgi:hypothetical protein